MAQLKVVITKNLVETVPLMGPVLIGRGEEAHIPLLDAAVSRKHIAIDPDGAGWVLRDLGSANGTLVNDERADTVQLQDGDVIKVGGKVLVFTDDIPLEVTGAVLDWSDGDPDPAAVAAAIDQDVVRFKFPSNEAVIEAGLDAVRTIIQRGPLTPSEADALHTATREAVTNGIMHGNGGDPKLTVALRVSVDADKVRCTVEDQGPGFDYRGALEAGRTRHAMELARERYESGGVGGLGIMLMLRSVDLVEYNAQGNVVTITKWRGDFYRDETIYGSLGLFAENDEPSEVPRTTPRNATVQFEPPMPPAVLGEDPFAQETFGIELSPPDTPADTESEDA